MPTPKIMSVDGTWVRPKLGAKVIATFCPYCKRSTRFTYVKPHVYLECRRCKGYMCSFNKAHEKKHAEEDLQWWLDANSLTRNSVYALPALGENQAIKGTPECLLRDAIDDRQWIYSFTENNIKSTCKEWTDRLTPLWKMPEDRFYLLIDKPMTKQ